MSRTKKTIIGLLIAAVVVAFLIWFVPSTLAATISTLLQGETATQQDVDRGSSGTNSGRTQRAPRANGPGSTNSTSSNDGAATADDAENAASTEGTGDATNNAGAAPDTIGIVSSGEGQATEPASPSTPSNRATPARANNSPRTNNSNNSSTNNSPIPDNPNTSNTSNNSNNSTTPDTPATYTISYNLDGGTANTAGLPTTYTAASDTLSVDLPTPSKANYKFYRWENAAGEPVTKLTIPKGSTGNVALTAKWMTTNNIEYVETHTPQEIANYIAQSGFNPNMPDGDTMSDISKGDVGSVSQAVQNNALAGFNIIRYLAGVNPVTFDEGAYNKAQAGAAYMAYTGTVTHYPDRKLVPDSTPADVFDRAVHGCGESNVVAGNGIANVVIGSFVPDPGNIASGKGHRRFCLNPALKSAAFGSASNRHADGSVHGGRTLYVMNEGAPYNQHFTVWPPSNMPMEYYPKVNSQRTYWTVCLHRQGQITAQKANLRVTLKYDGKTVTLRPDQGDCYFNAGTLMWRIDRDVKAGDKIDVKVEGVTDTSPQRRPVPIEYTVNFFNLSDYQASTHVSSVPADTQANSVASAVSAATDEAVAKVLATQSADDADAVSTYSEGATYASGVSGVSGHVSGDVHF